MGRTRLAAMLLFPAALAACAAGAPGSPDVGQGSPAAGAPAADGLASVLPRYHWHLRRATDAGGRRIDALFVRAERPLMLRFEDGRIGIDNACNRIGGAYAVHGDTLVVGRLQSTLMACADPGLMALDREAGSRIEGRLAVLLAESEPPRLRLSTVAGDTLEFEAEPTAETRYGGPGETVFLEVAARTAPCPHPRLPGKQCLQVRELQYDANGLRQGTPGDFGRFDAAIEGYTHEPGVRNVLRVRRYRIAQPAADAPDAAYVLDMVVESEVERP